MREFLCVGIVSGQTQCSSICQGRDECTQESTHSAELRSSIWNKRHWSLLPVQAINPVDGGNDYNCTTDGPHSPYRIDL